MYKQPPVDRARLQRAVVLSVIVHAIGGGLGWCGMRSRASTGGSTSLVDIEIAPAAPKAEHLPDEILRQYPASQTQTQTAQNDETPKPASGYGELPDAAPAPDAELVADERVDARRRHRADAAETQVAVMDAGRGGDGSSTAVAVGGDGGYVPGDGGMVATTEPGTGSGLDPGGLTGSEDATGAPPGVGSADDVLASPGTTANLISYFPKGHIVTAMIRFDRIRGSRWEAPVNKLFRPMPDHQTLIPADKGLSDLFDTLVISSTNPVDPRAGTLVVRHHMTREQLRDALDTPDTPVTWSVVRGGVMGTRGAGDKVLDHDDRQFLFPFDGWLMLAHPDDLPGLFAPAKGGDLDTSVATGTLPAWLAGVRKIEDESGKKTGPTLVLTMAFTAKRYDLPDLLGAPSVPAPERLTVSLEFVKGFIVRGNMKFATEDAATEFVETMTKVRDQVLDSAALRIVLNRARALNVITGLSFDRRGNRVSYATSASLADADAILAISGQWLEAWFEEAQEKAAEKAAEKAGQGKAGQGTGSDDPSK